MWPDIINKSRMAVFLLVMIISGCLGFNNPPYGTSMETVLEDKVKEIYPGETDRDAVLRIMGEPIISSRYWKIDVFRSTEKQYAGVVVLVPLPIPVWSNDLIHRDTIVHYNSDDIVDHFDSKAYLKSDPWSVTLEIGKLQVRNDSDNKMFILLESEEMKEYLDYVSKKEECVIILGCKFDWDTSSSSMCGTSFSFDNYDAFYWPYNPKRIRAIVGGALRSGNHTLYLSQKDYDSEASFSFTCKENKTLYITVNPVERKSEKILSKKEIQWTFELSEEPSDIFVGHPLLIFVDGKWIRDFDE